MERGDWCICPASGMPALMSHYEEYLRWESMNGVSESTTTRDGQVNELPPQHGSHEVCAQQYESYCFSSSFGFCGSGD